MGTEDSLTLADVSEPEVRKQLAQIVNSSVFGGTRNRINPTRIVQLLDYIVDRTLKKLPLSGQDILDDVYRKTGGQEGANDAKVGVSKLRETLNDYYESVGANDFVIITIPLQQYLARFDYNPRSHALREVKEGFVHVHLESPNHIALALEHFDKAIKAEPSFSEAYVGKAAALLTRTLHTFTEPAVPSLAEAEAAARRARELNTQSWAAGVHLGAVHLFRHKWKEADSEFKQAAEARPLGVFHEGAYGPYLLARGRYKEVSTLIQFYQNEYADNSMLLRRASLYLYVLRRFEEAERLASKIIAMESHLWLAHLTLVFSQLAMGRASSALNQMRLVRTHAKGDMWPGLYVLCLAEAGELSEASERFNALLELSAVSYVQPMQMALGYIALEQPQEAIRQLSDACDAFDPFTAWLHLWPFLDPLRGRADFQSLLRKWRFPDGVS